MKTLLKVKPVIGSDWILAGIIILMSMSGLAMVVFCHFMGINIGRVSIIISYAAYLLPCVLFLAINFRRQFFISNVDLFVIPFFLVIFFGLLLRLYVGLQIEAPRNFVYFFLFSLFPFLLGRTANLDVIQRYEFILIGCVAIILCLLLIPGVVTYIPTYGRPTFFSTEFSRITLAFMLGLGVLLTASMGQASSGWRRGVGYALLLMLILIGAAFVTLRLPYYLTALFAIAMISLIRSPQNKYLIFGVFAGLLLGYLVSQDFVAYHSKILYVKTEQLPLSDLYLDFFGEGAWIISPGQSVLNNVDCLPGKTANDSVMIRVVLYLEAIKLFLSFPFFGVGVSTFSSYSCFTPHGFPHSTVLHIAAEMGLVGLLLFISIISISARSLFINAKMKIVKFWVFFAFIYFFILDQAFGSYFFSVYTYFLVGLASRLSLNIPKKEVVLGGVDHARAS